LVEIARLLNLGSYLFLGRGEEVSGGRQKRAMLADAFEALIAAVYLDGGMEAARKLIHKLVLTGGADGTAPRISPERDYKTGLQELARARGLPLPEYRVVRERGPEHAKTFTVEVRLGPTYSAQADGPSKKGASQDAARRVYLHLTEDGPEPAVSPPR
jgi:ribonuclease-3